MLLPLAVFLSTLVSSSVALKAVGTPFGYASGVTGGGDRTPVIPKDIKELASLLADSTPRVILLDKLYDFIGSEGTEYGKICKVRAKMELGREFVQVLVFIINIISLVKQSLILARTTSSCTSTPR
jgi:hypothetical protein